jgi:chromate reductase
VTPEYNRSIPGGLKNAIDWASRPWGKNSFAQKPSAVIGKPGLFTDTGEVNDENVAQFLRDYMNEFREFIVRVFTVLPRQA